MPISRRSKVASDLARDRERIRRSTDFFLSLFCSVLLFFFVFGFFSSFFFLSFAALRVDPVLSRIGKYSGIHESRRSPTGYTREVQSRSRVPLGKAYSRPLLPFRPAANCRGQSRVEKSRIGEGGSEEGCLFVQEEWRFERPALLSPLAARPRRTPREICKAKRRRFVPSLSLSLSISLSLRLTANAARAARTARGMIRIPYGTPARWIYARYVCSKVSRFRGTPSRREQRLRRPRRRAYLSTLPPSPLPPAGIAAPVPRLVSRIFMRARWQERREDTRAGVMARISAPDLEQRFSAERERETRDVAEGGTRGGRRRERLERCRSDRE